MRYFARTLSFLLHPLVVPLYILCFLFHGDTLFACLPRVTKLYAYMVTDFSLLLMPLASLPVFRYFGLIRDYRLERKQERVFPILVAVAFAFAGFWFLGLVPYSHIVRQLYLVLIVLLSAFSVITLRWKMSMHMTAIGGFCGFLMVFALRYGINVRTELMCLLLLAGLLGSCRLYLGKHTPAQVYAGFFFGLCFVYGIF